MFSYDRKTIEVLRWSAGLSQAVIEPFSPIYPFILSRFPFYHVIGSCELMYKVLNDVMHDGCHLSSTSSGSRYEPERIVSSVTSGMLQNRAVSSDMKTLRASMKPESTPLSKQHSFSHTM